MASRSASSNGSCRRGRSPGGPQKTQCPPPPLAGGAVRLHRRRRSPEKLAPGERPGGTHRREPVDGGARCQNAARGLPVVTAGAPPQRMRSEQLRHPREGGSACHGQAWHFQGLWGKQATMPESPRETVLLPTSKPGWDLERCPRTLR